MSKHVQVSKVNVGDIIVIPAGVFRVQSIEEEGSMIKMEIQPLGVNDPDNVPTSYSAHRWQRIEAEQGE